MEIIINDFEAVLGENINGYYIYIRDRYDGYFLDGEIAEVLNISKESYVNMLNDMGGKTVRFETYFDKVKDLIAARKQLQQIIDSITIADKLLQ